MSAWRDKITGTPQPVRWHGGKIGQQGEIVEFGAYVELYSIFEQLYSIVSQLYNAGDSGCGILISG